MTVADVSTPSAERSAMEADLQIIADVRAGVEAMRARSGSYLPSFELESVREYRRRVAAAPWRPEFVDALRSLASKPFSSDVLLADDTPPIVAKLAEDIDGCGNNLTRFAHSVFTEAVANGVHAILIDYPPMPENASRADEIAMGGRPYWVSLPVKAIIDLRTEIVRGREVVTHLRYHASRKRYDGFSETLVPQIQVREAGYCGTWEQDAAGAWQLISEGEVRCAGKDIGEVPLALFFTGERLGTLQTRSALRDLAEVQIELYRALSRQEEILTFAGSPMLTGNGLSPAKPGEGEAMAVGPKAVLFAPRQTEGPTPYWDYIQPAAANIKEIREHVESVIANMHRLGMSPSIPLGRVVTATASAINAAKAHSALEAWATGLKDCLEQAFRFTAMFLGSTHDTVVQVFSDFAIGDQDTNEAGILLDAVEAGVISNRTMREELRRRNILGPQFDPAQEARRLANERRSATPSAAPVENEPRLPPQVETDPAIGSFRRRRKAVATT